VSDALAAPQSAIVNRQSSIALETMGMAKIDVIMPQMGESIAEGTISKWLKKVGDPVKRDEPIFEISTDKVDAEIPAPSAGVLAEILVEEGKTVAVQTVVARIETDGAGPKQVERPVPAAESRPAAEAKSVVEPKPAQEKAAPPPTPPAPPAAAKPPSPSPSPASAAPAPDTATSAPLGPASGASPPPRGEETMEERLRRRSTPLVRRMVADHQLDLAEIPGTGLTGRVTKQDVLDYLERGATAPAAAPSAPAPPSVPAAATAPAPGPSVEPWDGDRVEPWSRIRKLTADHMIMSRRVSAHVHSMIEVDYSAVAQLRARKKAEYAERGVSLTFLAFIAKAVADNLRKHPVLNAAVMGESTIVRRDINLGIAVALDWGLIVPVIRHADELSLIGIARAINDLAERARGKRLSPDEVQKGTFTITNPGVFGSYLGLPILNQPQSGILAVGAIEKRPAVVTADDGGDALAIRTLGMLALSFDHRIVDGADADRFLADLRRTLEEFAESAT
jgi:pyruvate dehydrogenase E2 component (dihydrolipoamide acetyltransferase)